MESNRQLSSHQSDEIDLVAFLSKFVIAIKKNLILIILAVSIGIGLGYMYYKMSPRVYESNMLVMSEILTESHSEVLINNLNKLVREHNLQALSKKLNISPDQASGLSSFEVKNVTPKIVIPDPIEKDKSMYYSIQARTQDNTSWKDLEAGLKEYFKSSEYVTIRAKQNEKLNSELIKRIDSELADLESLKVNRAAGKDGAARESLIYFNPASINSIIIDLNRERFKLQKLVENAESVQVVEGFNAFENSVSPKLSLSLSGGLLFGIFVIIAVFIAQGVHYLLKGTPENH